MSSRSPASRWIGKQISGDDTDVEFGRYRIGREFAGSVASGQRSRHAVDERSMSFPAPAEVLRVVDAAVGMHTRQGPVHFARGIGAELNERFDSYAAIRGLLQLFLRAGFRRADCAATLEARIRSAPATGRFLSTAALTNGEPVATADLLYAPAESWTFGFFDCERREPIRFLSLPASQARNAARVLRSMLRVGDSDALREALPKFRPEDIGALFDPARRRAEWPSPNVPGIYRREHASVMIQTRTARLLVDPVSMSPVAPLATSVIPDENVDAVLITHSHGDHWHIPSILASAPGAATPVVVPHVPRATLLCPDLNAQLAAVGQTALDPTWGAILTFGDIEVDVLPFYGEQPAVDARCPSHDVRNWGNCYRVNTPDFSALILADTGADPAGDMLDVVADSVAKRGAVDVVMACMRDFLSPFEIGSLESYWVTLPFAELERLYTRYRNGTLATTTAGLAHGGIARLCAAARARSFAPYAQGFAGIREPVPAGEWGPSPTLSEAAALEVLRRQLDRAHIDTLVQEWNPGDALVPDSRALLRHCA